MREKAPQYDNGVLIGRFQVHELHDGHRDLIQHVCARHSKVVIFLGLSPLPTSVNNPLDFEARKQMILAEFPDVNVLYIKDQPSDAVWSKKLDEQVNDTIIPGQSAVLYGGRDSFVEHYAGRFPTIELEESGSFLSGQAIRRQIAKSRVKGSPDFRAGVIWASQARFPTAYTTVDVAIFNEDRSRILLGRKPNETQWRLPGGFSDPRSESFEADARREAAEETGCEIGDLRYIGSRVQEDWRYRAEPDCIKTLLFAAKYLHGPVRAGDDLEEVRWVEVAIAGDLMQYAKQNITPAHRPLLKMLGYHLEEQR